MTQQRATTQARQFWQRAAWTRSANITNEEGDYRPVADGVGGQGSLVPIDFDALDAMETRKVEEERYAFFAEASVIFLDLPDAVYRGYEGDDQLLGSVRDDDSAPYELLRSEILRLEPQMVYFPLAVGGHVDHQLCREVGLSLLPFLCPTKFHSALNRCSPLSCASHSTNPAGSTKKSTMATASSLTKKARAFASIPEMLSTAPIAFLTLLQP